MAKRDYSWFYKSAPEGLLMSASQYKLVNPDNNPCWAFYGFKHLEKVKEPQGEAAGKGDGHHTELELWVKLRRLPKHAAPLRAMQYGAAPGIAEAEVPIFFFHEGVGFVGFVDLVYDWETEKAWDDKLEEWVDRGVVRPLGSTGHTVIHDWKFTSSLRNAMSEEELANDPAANMYAWEAFLGGAQRVSCRWVYTEFEGSHSVRQVWAEMKFENVLRIITKMATDTKVAWEKKRAHKRGLLNVLDMPCQTGHCFDFRRECAYKTVQDPTRPHLVCKPLSTIRMPPPPTGAPQMSEAFRQSLSNFPGVSSAGAPAVPPKGAPAVPAKVGAPAVPPKASAPAVPPKVAAPAVPPKDLTTGGKKPDLSDAEARALVAEHLAAQGKDPAFASAPGPVVESGFVNPGRYAPAVPAKSPEHAAELQNIKKPEPAAPVVDELSELTKDQLVALAIAELGPDCKASKRMREDTLRNMIRLGRINGGGQASPIENHTEPVAADEFGQAASVQAEGVPVKDVRAAAEAVCLTAGQIARGAGNAADEEIRNQADADQALHYVTEKAKQSRVLELHTIVDAANLKLAADGYPMRGEMVRVRDWRQIPFEGGAALNCVVYDLFGAGTLDAEVVVFDDRTPEGLTLKATLIGLARAGKFVLVNGDLI